MKNDKRLNELSAKEILKEEMEISGGDLTVWQEEWIHKAMIRLASQQTQLLQQENEELKKEIIKALAYNIQSYNELKQVADRMANQLREDMEYYTEQKNANEHVDVVEAFENSAHDIKKILEVYNKLNK